MLPPQASGGGNKDSAPTEESSSAPASSFSSGETHDIKIPSFGDSINTASLAEWKVKSGEAVSKGQTLITLESDKVSQDLDAEYSGTIEILVEEGEEVEIGTVIARLTEGEGAAASSSPSSTPAPEKKRRKRLKSKIGARGSSCGNFAPQARLECDRSSFLIGSGIDCRL